MTATTDWYKDAIFYQLHVKTFCDSDSDGVGDFKGLAGKLDYVVSLGVDCLWLLPTFPSPFRDDGYDIADYYDIHPTYGSLADFREFVAAAHAKGLRVITELVLNHTSDKHPWFQEARSSRDNPRRDWYVWSDTDERYRNVRIIFLDTEPSNWAWDPISKAYYWHRFFSHQPDLNYDNPAVRDEIWNVMKFWLDIGVDGFRVDAVPYLIEREGTSCENLPETHDVLKFLRRRLDEHFTGKVLLAEANQWPEDVRPYFGDGDEFHMAFHFPLMPRMFMALRLEDRKPIVEIIERTPALPDSCQWGIFLRNHDELTLEMVTTEERDYMYDEYAHDPVARLNLGIRRRLSPLLEGDRRRVELLGVDVLGFVALQGVVAAFTLFVPRLLVAIAILVVGFVIANFAWRATLLAAVNAGIPSPRVLSAAVRALVLVLAAAMALDQIALARTIVLAAFAISFGAVMLGLAIAFGVGGGPVARRILEHWFPEQVRSEIDELRHL
jgi:maltose alpha-D-glucosyltransferase/alpha-amylase